VQRHRFLFLSALAVAVGAPGTARANYITLNPNNKLSVRTADSGQVRVSGTYELVNSGDESAYRVFVALNLGAWSYLTEPVRVSPGERKTFEIDESFPSNQLACQGTAVDLCGGLALPAVGTFALRVAQHYQDKNGYDFSSAAVAPVQLGSLTPEQRYVAQLPPAKVSLQIRRRDANKYAAEVTLRNLADVAQTLVVSLITAREIPTHRRPFAITLSAASETTESIELVNQGALIGSTYHPVVIASGEMKGARYLVQASAPLAIMAEERSGPFVLLAMIAVGTLVLVILSILRLRRRHHLPGRATAPSAGP
jgi:hypothetical protein